MNMTRAKLTSLAIGMLTMLVAPPAHAGEWDKRTVVTLQQPIQIQGRTFGPGQYVFKLLESQSDRRIVQIYSAGEARLELTVIAVSTFRLEATEETVLLFDPETPDRSAPTLRTWYFAGETYGVAFMR